MWSVAMPGCWVVLLSSHERASVISPISLQMMDEVKCFVPSFSNRISRFSSKILLVSVSAR